MSYAESIHWREGAERMRALAEEQTVRLSRRLTYRSADNDECFARTLEQRPKRVLAIAPAVTPEVRRYATCKKSFDAVTRIIDFELPGFLKRGPATADELGASL